MTTKRGVPVIFILVFMILSFTPTISAQLAVLTKLPNLFKFAKNFKKGFEFGDKVANSAQQLQDLGIQKSSALDPPTDLSVLDQYGFYTTFIVNNQEVNAWIAINSPVTWINNYYPVSSLNYACYQNDGSWGTGIDPINCFSYPDSYTPAANLFVFDRVTSYKGNFLWSKTNYVANNQIPAAGVLSFDRDMKNAYSIVNKFQYPGFSYYFTLKKTEGSSITFGVKQPDMNFPYIQLLPPNVILGYESLYYVPPPVISIGSQSLPINPTTDFKYGVIIDTVVLYILLAPNVYSNVTTELQNQIPLLQQDFVNGMMCSDNAPDWPPITLSFSPGAKMVLERDNYVVTDPDTNKQCAAVYLSPYITVIGLIAQLDRKMTFDVKNSVLYFDNPQSSDQDTKSVPPSDESDETTPSVYAGAARPTIAFILVVYYFIISLLGLYL